MVKSLLYILAVLSMAYISSSAQEIAGTVRSSFDGEPLIGASVFVQGSTTGALTDFDGKFSFNYSGAYPVTIEITYVGYLSQDLELTSATSGLSIILDEEGVTLEDVVIRGQRISDKQKKAPLTVESLDLFAIKDAASDNFYDALGTLKGVDITAASLGFKIINTRGFNSTSPVRSLQIIDGVDNQAPGLNFSLGNFLGSSELDVLKVDIVAGASSAFFGPNAFNGVIAMETKNPFFQSGLAASVKVGERNLTEAAIRYADVFKNKAGQPYMAFKLNFSYLRANDWVADNYDPITDSDGNRVFSAAENPGGFNAVNIYGDEYSSSSASLADRRTGLNVFHRRGYLEEDLVDYNTRNIKAGAAVHFRTNPAKGVESPEFIVASNFGYGTTVYQGDNRFSLRGITFYQQRLEYRKKDKFFIRAYATNENAGRSYDPYLTAQLMQEAAATNEEWQNAYAQWWVRNDLGDVFDEIRDLGYPSESTEDQIRWQQENRDLLVDFHQQASNYANTANNVFGTIDFFEPGTARFDSLFNDITSRKNNSEENGSLFVDRSALYHVHGEYRFESDFFSEIVLGANGRMYRPNSEGTIFIDSTERITNNEFGIYGGLSKNLGDFSLSATMRVDKNENFPFLYTPAGSVVWNPSPNNFLRFSFSSGVRNPTLSDQYLNLTVGPATLIGNLEGRENLITLESFNAWRENQSLPFEFRDIDPIRPERVRTTELGYRTTLFDRLYVDLSFYYNVYNDFIGFQIGLDIPQDKIEPFPGGDSITIFRFAETEVFRIAANSTETVTSRGSSLGLSYYFGKYYSLNGNYSYNELITDVQDDIIPAFNTPRHKFNIGITARNIPLGNKGNFLGFNINYRWIEGFIFEGSPQFTGFVPTYDLVDAQINYFIPKRHLTFKLGASNLLNNLQFQTYGGPRIGRMAYMTITYDFVSKV